MLFLLRPGVYAQPSPATQAARLLPPGTVARSADTIAGMQVLTALTNGTYVVVHGYRTRGDQGGGVFRYDSRNDAKADDGSIISPSTGSGRFLRLIDPDGDAYAEWFGAYGDGRHADEIAINACLAVYGKVRLLAKTYGVRGRPERYNPKITYHAIDLATGWKIEGVNRAVTRVRLLDGSDPVGSEPSNNYFHVLANRSFYESADDVVVRDLTIDANFEGQNRWSTISCVDIRGGNALVERVNFRGYGTGRHPANGSSLECFVMRQTLVYKDAKASRRAATLRHLDFTDPGPNGDFPSPLGEVTHILVGGANNFVNSSWILRGGRDPAWDPDSNGENENNWWPSYGGLVEGCVIHDVSRGSRLKSNLIGITYCDCVGMTIRGNRVEEFDGAGVFVMSWWNKATTIVDNQFIDVENGITFQIMGAKGVPRQYPLHQDVLVERNTIRTGKPRQTELGARGLHIYGQELGTGIRFRNLTIRNNNLSGRAFSDSKGRRVYPRGLLFQVMGRNYDGIRICDNVIDMPDHAPGGVVPDLPGSLSLTFFPMTRWAEDVRAGRVLYRANRDPAGKELDPILADWDYKNRPHWGRRQGAVPIQSR